LLLECGKLDEALKYYERVLEIDPNNMRAAHYKNKILGKIKKSKKQHFFAR
jgi:predicted TPR repeat methyltransferase